MQRSVVAAFVLGACLASVPAVAQTPADEETDEQPAKPNLRPRPLPAPPPPVATVPEVAPPPEPVADPGAWRTSVSGYFRAPVAMGISSRPGPDNPTGPAATQISYGPNRTVDSNYFSFAYTRLQEQDWAEVFVHAKKPHVDAAVGWMGYWFQAVGFRNPDAAWAPGLAYLTLDSDFKLGEMKPNAALTVGAFWPAFGYFEQYDTYTLGRFRQIGEQLKLTVPLPSELTVALVQGFGTNRDGSFNYLAPPFYGAITGLDLITWENIQLTYKRLVDVGLHYNTEWTRDPNLTQQSVPGDKSYMAAALAHLTVVGAQVDVHIPVLGRLWISPSYIHVRNGWALASAGTEVMHSLGGMGIATNYLAWTGSPTDSSGSGSMFNFGFLYQNSLSNLYGKQVGTLLPDAMVSLFGLYTSASLDLPSGSTLTQNSIKQFKYGADLTLQTLTTLAFSLRYDLVNYDLDHPGLIFSSLTVWSTVSSHFLSGERIYLQVSRYDYGDKMVLNGIWPWGAPLVAGSNVLQQGPYSGQKPDATVVKLQAEIAF
jgi:hypothetical protein